jgi:hypothetical protein
MAEPSLLYWSSIEKAPTPVLSRRTLNSSFPEIILPLAPANQERSGQIVLFHIMSDPARATIGH